MENMTDVLDVQLGADDLKVIYQQRNEILNSAKMPDLYQEMESSD